MTRWIGTLLITFGVMLVGFGEIKNQRKKSKSFP